MLLILPTAYRDQTTSYWRKLTKWKKRLGTVVMTSWPLSFPFYMISYVDGNVSGAIEETWRVVLIQIRVVVDHVVSPAIGLILAVFSFGKLGTAYFDFRKHGQFEWNRPAILFTCLVFTLIAPTYIWQTLGM